MPFFFTDIGDSENHKENDSQARVVSVSRGSPLKSINNVTTIDNRMQTNENRCQCYKSVFLCY